MFGTYSILAGFWLKIVPENRQIIYPIYKQASSTGIKWEDKLPIHKREA